MKTYNKILIVIAVFFFTATGFSQNILQGKPGPELEQQASEIAERWADELAMSPEQTELMEDVLIEFAIKKNKAIQSNLPKQEKSQTLIDLQERQFSDIRDILTKPQFEKYVQLSKEARRAQKRENP